MLIIILDIYENWFEDYVYDNRNGTCLKEMLLWQRYCLFYIPKSNTTIQ